MVLPTATSTIFKQSLRWLAVSVQWVMSTVNRQLP